MTQVFSVPHWLNDSDLDVYEFRIYARLVRLAADETYTDATVRRIVEGTGMSTRRARQALASIEKQGFILREYRTGRGQTTVYHILPHPGTAND